RSVRILSTFLPVAAGRPDPPTIDSGESLPLVDVALVASMFLRVNGLISVSMLRIMGTPYGRPVTDSGSREAACGPGDLADL
ncbi:MAG TPA: hypothetical protein VLD62_09080, partial [Acidimicrobiia bacterium]|nr:hypothetical protein [Acidimicrobiia bacterium]